MTTAVLYARYSTAMQSAASIDDQLRELHRRSDREGWTVTGTFHDRAISGTVRQRPGLNAAMAAIERGTATTLLTESLDRLSRDQEDLAGIFKRIRFNGGRIVTLAEGEVGAIHIGMGGTISAVMLEQLAEKVRRGHIGRVEAGCIPGGLSYGYRQIRTFDDRGELIRGLREVDQDQAAIVCRIFAAYAAGESPRAIAAALNAEAIPSPRGGIWRPNAISGHRQRGNGILHNRLYTGCIVYNRQTFRKDPETRKRIARSTAVADRVEREVSELRIIDPATWQAVQDRLALYVDKPAHQARRPKRLLSGMMKCGVCRGSIIAIGPNRWGCSNAKQAGSCTNGKTITDTVAQQRIWSALQTNLLHPDLIAAHIDELRIGLTERRRERIAAHARTDRRLAELDAEDRHLVEAIAAGLPLESLRTRAEAIAAERADLRAEGADAELAAIEAAIIHPGIADHYRKRIEALHHATAENEALRSEARAVLVELIDHIELRPREDGQRGVDMLVHGSLAQILQLSQNNKSPADQGEAICMLTMVAGVGFSRCHTMAFAA